MKPLLLVGCGGHARSVIDIIESEKKNGKFMVLLECRTKLEHIFWVMRS